MSFHAFLTHYSSHLLIVELIELQGQHVENLSFKNLPCLLGVQGS
jgi:hypothetical protein